MAFDAHLEALKRKHTAMSDAVEQAQRAPAPVATHRGNVIAPRPSEVRGDAAAPGRASSPAVGARLAVHSPVR